VKRRDALKFIAISGAAASAVEAQDPGHTAHRQTSAVQGSNSRAAAMHAPYKPKYFSPHEYAVISRLADLIIPRDTTPGALDAGVPEYIDLQVSEMPAVQVRLSGGVQWFDRHCVEQFGEPFLDCNEPQQRLALDQLANSKNLSRELKAGRLFFAEVRDLTCDGFYSSKFGFSELGYKGNTGALWRGCTHPEHGA
jgi:gluconate 2-dehydrogenase subunit 3-like protein